jgi:hypothetical protein
MATATGSIIPFSRQQLFRLAVTIIGAAVLVSQTFGLGLAAEPTADQREADRQAFGALSGDTVSVILTSSSLGANVDDDDDSGSDEEDVELQGIQGLEKKAPSTSVSGGVTVETVRLGIVKSGYLDRCSEGLNDVTVVVKNNLQTRAEGVLVRVYSDNNQNRAAEAVITSLDAGKSAELGFDNVYIKKGKHKLTAALRLVPITMLEAKSASEQSYTSSKTIRVKCDDKKDKEEKEEA